MPHLRHGGDEETEWEINTLAYKLAADYAGVSLYEIFDICWLDYCALLHDAAIWRYQQTEAGREYLHDCWVDKQDGFDEAAARRLFGADGRLGGN